MVKDWNLTAEAVAAKDKRIEPERRRGRSQEQDVGANLAIFALNPRTKP